MDEQVIESTEELPELQLCFDEVFSGSDRKVGEWKLNENINDVNSEECVQLERLLFKRMSENSDLKIFPIDYISELKQELDMMKAENARLSRSLNEAEYRIKLSKCSHKGEKDKEVPSPLRSVGRASDLAANKIVELSKKVQELNTELIKAQDKLRGAKDAETTEDVGVTVNLLESKDAEFEEINQKLTAANSRLRESRDVCQQLRQDLRLAHRAIAQEVGENVTIQSVLNSQSNWRGRAQQILTLQQKVQELTTKLESKSSERPTTAMTAQSKLERTKVLELTKELQETKTELEETTKKLDASKVRITVLTSDVSALKSKIAGLNDKSTEDQNRITVLLNQMTNLTEQLKEAELVYGKQYENQISDLKQELVLERNKYEKLEIIIQEKEDKIKDLMEKVREHKTTPSPVIQERPPSRCSATSRKSSMDSLMVQNNNLTMVPMANEAERIRLMELLTVLNKRLDDERLSCEKSQDLLRQERHKCARLETKVARLEMEKINRDKGCYRSLSAKSTILERNDAEWEALKDRAEFLEEKCLALETRLKRLSKEKDEDSRMYRSLIEETRKSFVEHIRSISA